MGLEKHAGKTSHAFFSDVYIGGTLEGEGSITPSPLFRLIFFSVHCAWGKTFSQGDHQANHARIQKEEGGGGVVICNL